MFCVCGHENVEHTDRWGKCHAVIREGLTCPCPRYEEEN
jgi:hypothetical protein